MDKSHRLNRSLRTIVSTVFDWCDEGQYNKPTRVHSTIFIFFGFSDGKQPRFQDPCEEFLSNKAYHGGIRSWLEFFECAMLCAAMKLLLLFCWVKGEK